MWILKQAAAAQHMPDPISEQCPHPPPPPPYFLVQPASESLLMFQPAPCDNGTCSLWTSAQDPTTLNLSHTQPTRLYNKQSSHTLGQQ